MIRSNVAIWLTLLLAAFCPAAERIYSPADTVTLALADLPNVVSYKTPRYLSLHNHVPAAERVKYKQSIDFVLNSLSRERTIKKTRGVPNDVDPILLSFDLYWYGIDSYAYGRLISRGSGPNPFPETYYYEPRLVYDEETKTKVRRMYPALWTPPEKFQALRDAARTNYPLVRGDWFLTYAMYGKAYYDLLGLDPDKGTIKDFDKLVRADTNLSKGLELTGVTDTKIVTLHNRRLVRISTVNGLTGGYRWQSDDTDDPVDDGDYLNQLVKPKIKAHEIIASLANGLQAYALTDAQDKLLDVAAIRIARNKKTKLDSPEVWNGMSCAHCHDEGLWNVEDKVRNLAEKNVAVFVTHQLQKNGKFNEDEVKAVVEQFIFRPEPVLARDRTIYAEAVLQCNGLTTKVNAKQFEELVWSYLDRPMVLDDMAKESGMAPDDLKKLLEGTDLDHTIASMLRGDKAPRIAWERQGFRLLMTKLYP